MKIICIGRNYADHAKEMKSSVPTEPVFFMKPDTALVTGGKPVFYPEFTKDLHHEVEIVVRINRIGKHIDKKFAHKYYDEIAVGVDFTARDKQAECKDKGLPWEIAKAFDGSAPVSDFIKLADLKNRNNIDFHLTLNGELRQRGQSSDMIFDIDAIIAYISKFVTLKIGDLIFTGTPAGVGAVAIDDVIECFVEGTPRLRFRVK